MLLHGFIDARHPHLIWMAWSESPFAGSDFLSFFLVNEATSQNALRDRRKILWRADNGATSRRDDGAMSYQQRGDFAATSQKGLRDVRNCPGRPPYGSVRPFPIPLRSISYPTDLCETDDIEERDVGKVQTDTKI